MIDGQEFIVKLEDCGNHEFAGSSHTTYPEKKKKAPRKRLTDECDF